MVIARTSTISTRIAKHNYPEVRLGSPTVVPSQEIVKFASRIRQGMVRICTSEVTLHRLSLRIVPSDAVLCPSKHVEQPRKAAVCKTALAGNRNYIHVEPNEVA